MVVHEVESDPGTLGSCDFPCAVQRVVVSTANTQVLRANSGLLMSSKSFPKKKIPHNNLEVETKSEVQLRHLHLPDGVARGGELLGVARRLQLTSAWVHLFTCNKNPENCAGDIEHITSSVLLCVFLFSVFLFLTLCGGARTFGTDNQLSKLVEDLCVDQLVLEEVITAAESRSLSSQDS